ncbi:universal stress protein [Parasulfitobacter algicola]|uniref:Universal stress protein n=1 Tax=Parasulfitobacter algicola TaxID=2614809 RepID=A0ABX2ITE8_9RHOB|nr:universal stress protein [Sulfitobacter algicola]NSX54355.1 universal stress protein [Sulfitobacter algicola]
MINSILCAIDVSTPGTDLDVLQMAQKLSDLEGAQLDVITVVPDYGKSVVGGFFSDDHHEKVITAAKTQLNATVEQALGAEANKAVRHVVATGQAYNEILRLADKIDCKLIVIGAHKEDFKDYLLGPNAARVVRHSKCSVFVVR